jgi:hypothetical protein
VLPEGLGKCKNHLIGYLTHMYNLKSLNGEKIMFDISTFNKLYVLCAFVKTFDTQGNFSHDAVSNCPVYNKGLAYSLQILLGMTRRRSVKNCRH